MIRPQPGWGPADRGRVRGGRDAPPSGRPPPSLCTPSPRTRDHEDAPHALGDEVLHQHVGARHLRRHSAVCALPGSRQTMDMSSSMRRMRADPGHTPSRTAWPAWHSAMAPAHDRACSTLWPQPACPPAFAMKSSLHPFMSTRKPVQGWGSAVTELAARVVPAAACKLASCSHAVVASGRRALV